MTKRTSAKTGGGASLPWYMKRFAFHQRRQEGEQPVASRPDEKENVESKKITLEELERLAEERSYLKEQNEMLKLKLKELEEKCSRLEIDSRTMRQQDDFNSTRLSELSSEKADLIRLTDEREAECSLLKKQLAEEDVAMNNLKRLLRNCEMREQVENDHHRARQQLEDRRAACAAVTKEMTKAETELSVLQTKLIKTRQEYASTYAEQEESAARQDVLKKDLSRITEANRHINDKITRLTAARNRKTKNLNQLKEKYMTNCENFCRIQAKNDHAEEQLREIVNVTGHIHDEIKKKECELVNGKHLMRQLEEQQNQLKEKYMINSENFCIMKQKNDHAEEQLREIVNVTGHIHDEIKKKECELVNGKQRLGQLEAQLVATEDQLAIPVQQPTEIVNAQSIRSFIRVQHISAPTARAFSRKP